MVSYTFLLSLRMGLLFAPGGSEWGWCQLNNAQSDLSDGTASVTNSPANAGRARVVGGIPGSGRSLGVGNGNLLQYFCLGNPMDRGIRRATVCGVTKNWMLQHVHTHTHTHTHTQLATKPRAEKGENTAGRINCQQMKWYFRK